MVDRYDPHFWTSKDGTSCAIRDLEDRHILNILKFLFSLTEDHVRRSATWLARDLETYQGPNERSERLKKLSVSGTEREVRVAYTPQIPHLEAEAEIRGIEGWRYTLPEREVRKAFDSVVSDSAAMVKVFDSTRHNPNVPIKKELKALRASLQTLENAGFKIGV